MAEAYTRTLKFEVKDAQVRKAVKELGKSLDGIDKSLDKINQAFTKSVKGGIKETIKGVGEISAIVKDLANITKKIEVVPKQKITQSIKDIRKINNLMKQLKTVSSPFSGDGRKSDERNAAVDVLQKYINTVTNGTKAIGTNEAALNRQANAFALVAANVKIGSAQYINVVQAQEKAEQKLRLAQLDRIKAQEQLYAVSNLQGGIDQTGFKNVNKLLAMESKRFMEGGASDTTASLNAYKAELENVNSLLKIGSKEYYLVEEAIERINRRLGVKTRLVREEEKAVASQAKFYRDITVQIDKIARKGVRNIGKVFEGKFGGTAQAGGIYVLTRGIEDLTTKWKFLDQQLKIPLLGDRQLSSVANFVRRSQEGIAAIGISYKGLSGVLGAASWVTGAIGGALKWEEQMMLSIRRINTARKSLDQRMADALDRGENPLTGLGNFLRGKSGERGQKAEIADKGPSLQEELSKDIAHQLQLLTKTNAEASEYLGIQSKAIELQKRLNAELDQKKSLEVAAGKMASEVFAEEYRDFQDQNDKIRKGIKERYDDDKKFRDDQRQDADKLIKEKGQLRLNEVQKRWKAEADGHKRDMRRIAERANAEKQRREKRAAALSRFGENVMLGAGFPMLFGGGPGAVAGGLTGAIGQSLMGSKGFGMQIFFSAIGQQIDAFVGKTAELGKAFNDINPNVDAVIASLGETNTVYGRHLEILKTIKGEAAAMEEATRRLTHVIGKEGVESLSQFGQDAQDFGNEMGKAFTLMKASVAELINNSGILLGITKAIGKAARFVSAFEAANEGDKKMALLFAQRASIVKRQKSALSIKDKRIADADLKRQDNLIDQAEIARQGKFFSEDLLGPGAIATAKYDSRTKLLNEKMNPNIGERQAKINNEINEVMKKSTSKRNSKAYKEELASITAAVTSYYEAEDKYKEFQDKNKSAQDYTKKLADLDTEIAGQKELMNMEHGSYELREREAEIIRETAGLEGDKLEQVKDRLNKLYELQDVNENIRQQEEQLKAVYDAIGVSIRDGLVEGINAAIDGTKTLGEVASNTFRRISSALLNYGVNIGLSSLPGVGPMFASALGMNVGPTSLAGTSAGDLPGDLPLGASDLVGSLDGLAANGGPVKGGGSYIVGEKGPELFVPNSSGNIVPNHAMGGSTNVVVNVDASGSSVEGDGGQAEQLGSMLAAAVQAEIANQQRPGGLLAGTR